MTSAKNNQAAKAVEKAKKAASAVAGGASKKTRKVYTRVKFIRPKTFRAAKAPSFPRFVQNAAPAPSKMTETRILKKPLTSETAMKLIETNNTLVFITDLHASKPTIRSAFEKLYKVKVAKVNTLIRPTGDKKAFIKLSSEHDALDVANKIGLV